MKPVMLYGLMISVFLCFGSCKNTDEEFQPDDAQPPVPEGYVRMQITVPGLNPASTYALEAVDETKISEVDVLVFKDDVNDTYLCHAEGHSIAGAGNTKTFDVFLNTADRIPNAYVMVIANARQAVSTAVSFFSPSTTKEDVMKLLEFDSASKWNVPKAPATSLTPFPMWGMTASPVSIVDTNSIPDPVVMIRSVAGIDVGVNFNGTDAAQGLAPLTTFTLESVRLYNSLDKGSVAPYDGNYDFGDKKVTAVSIPGPVTSGTSSPGVNGEILYSLDADDGFSNSLSCTNVIYMAEQYAEPAVNGGGPANRPYLVIGGKYNGSPDVTYYRLDFVTGTYPSQTFLPVLRNHRYRFDITEVKGPGYDTPQEAFDAVPFNMTVSLSAMNESLVTSYVYNGQYALGTSHDSYNPDNRQHTDTLYLSTTYGSYSATASSNGDWLRFGSVPGSGNASIPVTTVSNTPVMLIFNVTENDTGLQRDGTITITSGLLKKEITVIQKNTENRFLVTPANSISYTSGGTKTDFRVTSSWKWNVRIKEDPDAIITAFTSSGNTGTSLTYNFTLATSTPRYYMSATLAATLVFFSPAGEFPEEERTISIPAHAITYQPSAHRGWAGSNIYWNQSLRGGNGALTFADAPSSTKGDAPETYQGVYFMWGSLVGLDPSYSYTITDSDKKSGTLNWTDACRVYVPTWNPSDPTASSWAGTKAGSSVPVYTVWTDIPYVTDGNTTTRNDAYLTRNDATPTVGNDNKGGHVPVPGETVSPENMKGDICRYLTQTGDAPGAATGTKWRMPTSTEFANPSGTTTISDYVSWGNFNYGNSTEATNSPAGTFPVPAGRYKKYSHLSSSQQLPVAQQPLFPAAGIRADGGSLYGVGRDGDYWSSSPNAADAYRLFFHIGSASPGDNSARQYGYAVRCVKE